MPSSRGSESPLKRKRSNRELNLLVMSDGFRSAAKSRPSIPDVMLTSEGEDNTDQEDSPSKRKTRHPNGSGIMASSSRRNGLNDTPTKPKPLIFVSSTDPRNRPKAKPLPRTKSAANTPVASASTGKGKGKQVDVEVDTPTRPRTRRDEVVVEIPSVKRKVAKAKKVDFGGGEEEEESRAGPSKPRTARRKDPTDDEDDAESRRVEDEDQDGLEDEQGSEDDEDEDRGSDDDEPAPASPTKRSPTKKSAKNKTESVLHVPGFITQSSFDVYFQQTSIPARTSDNAFTALLPTLSLHEYHDLLNSSPSHTKHAAELERLRESHVAHFERYAVELQAGFNLLFYGVGSKRNVLNQFAKDSLSKMGDVVVLNGYRSGVGVKDLLSRIEGMLGDSLSRASIPSSSSSTLSALELQAHRIYLHYTSSRRPLFVVIHNIDSPVLRNTKAKAILALLASNPQIHLVGSVDHMNSPLIWTQSEATGRGHPPSQGGGGRDDESMDVDDNEDRPNPVPAERNFTWLWHDLTTFEHYDVELRSQNRDLTSVTVSTSLKAKLDDLGAMPNGPAGAAGPLTAAGAEHTLSSVTERARKLFRLLGDGQLANIDEPNVPAPQMAKFAVSYEWLLRTAISNFVATSDDGMRALLGEFKDHGMVVQGASDGGEMMIWIPLAKNVLKQLLEAAQ